MGRRPASFFASGDHLSQCRLWRRPFWPLVRVCAGSELWILSCCPGASPYAGTCALAYSGLCTFWRRRVRQLQLHVSFSGSFGLLWVTGISMCVSGLACQLLWRGPRGLDVGSANSRSRWAVTARRQVSPVRGHGCLSVGVGLLWRLRPCFVIFRAQVLRFFGPLLVLFQMKFYLLIFRAGLQPLEVPRLGVELELQLAAHTTATAMPDPSRVCDLRHSSRQCRTLTRQTRPGVEPATSWRRFCVGSVSTVPQWERYLFNKMF